MAGEVKLELIIEALEMADDSVWSYLDVETGEVRSITEEEFDLAEDPQTVMEELPDWKREAVKLARSIQEQEGTRYLTLPDKFDVHEWAIIDRFSETLKDARLRNDFHDGIRGAGAFRLFKRLLTDGRTFLGHHGGRDYRGALSAVAACEAAPFIPIDE